MVKLWLARHARPLVAAGVCYGASDLAADARATLASARTLAAVLPAGIAVRSSPLRRCRQLAAALQALRPELVVHTDARISELDFGSWEGQTWDAIGREALERWRIDFTHHRCGGGECVADLMTRVGAAWDEARAADRDQLWITHGGVVRATRLLAAGRGLPLQASDWPQQGLAFGTWDCLALPPPV
jgi:alpha-ribazole phosphatase